jgi:hypothetical protein
MNKIESCAVWWYALRSIDLGGKLLGLYGVLVLGSDLFGINTGFDCLGFLFLSNFLSYKIGSSVI